MGSQHMFVVGRLERAHRIRPALLRAGRAAGQCAALALCLACGRGADDVDTSAAAAGEYGSEVVIPAHAQTHTYHCAGNMQFTLRVLPDTVWAVLPDRTVRLPRDTAASYPRFSNGDMDFSSNGEVQLETEETRYTGCHRQ